jgi:3-deoxy-7-phosphoheptulonate synthase
MMRALADCRIRDVKALLPPDHFLDDLPGDERCFDLVLRTRQAIHRILHGRDDRLILLIGPCSIHDPAAALDYASRLARKRLRFADDLEILMRVYFEKPRTTVGWKGLINDPYLDRSFRINDGLRIARELLCRINAAGVPCGSEYLDLMSPPYLADLISWGAIGARTTESQVHRELASGLPSPIGFKNSTDGNVAVAIDAIKAASEPHDFLSLTNDGRVAITSTTGNGDCHVVLRGGVRPNYDAASVDQACARLSAAGLPARVMIDASHANSGKSHLRQPLVCADIAQQVAGGDHRIVGVMIESNLAAGRQNLVPGSPLAYGQSVTDSCIGWNESMDVLETLAVAVRRRRKSLAANQAEGIARDDTQPITA